MCLRLPDHHFTDSTAVKTLFSSCSLMLVNATDWELARQILFLKVEDRILCDKLPKRITVTTAEQPHQGLGNRPLGGIELSPADGDRLWARLSVRNAWAA